MRDRPENASYFDWEKFEEFADNYNIGEATEDWEIFWDCWIEGHKAATS